MANGELSIQQKKEWAKLLITQHNHNQKEAAAKVGVSERTMSKWVNEELWDTMKKSLLTSKGDQLSMLYDQLDRLNTHIRSTDAQFPDAKQADTIIKLTAAIKNLEVEAGTGVMIETAMAFIKWLQVEDMAKAQEVTPLLDAFIKERLKAF